MVSDIKELSWTVITCLTETMLLLVFTALASGSLGSVYRPEKILKTAVKSKHEALLCIFLLLL